MLKWLTPWIPAVGLALVAVASIAAEVDMDLMQDIEEVNDSLASNIALEQQPAALADAGKLAEMFVVVEEHYVRLPDADDAVSIARESRSLISSIQTALDAKDFETAANSATDLSRACRACHTFYRED